MSTERGPASTEASEPTAMRVGVDTGGTFTDFMAWDGTRLSSRKVRSTPGDPARAILAGLRGPAPRELVHGSTVATNALLERSGSPTAFVATEGFEDLLHLARQHRADLYDWMPSPQPGLVGTGRTFGVAERMLHDGTVLRALESAEVERLLGAVGQAGSVAVCLLHSYANPSHEQQLGQALRAAGHDVYLSSELLPEYREYERAATTVVNAYVSPLMRRYVSSLAEALGTSRLSIFQSNGGLITVSDACNQAVRTILSGPAGGLVGAAAVAREAGIDRFVSLDMGGTSTDVSLFDRRLAYTTQGRAAGLPIHVPMLDIVSIGAGGGSIAYFDDGAALRVGPRSAGAVPGPVCYGEGRQLTVTDANLLLDRIDDTHFLEGTLRLDRARAREFARRMASRAGVTVRELALAIVRAANAKMERAIRQVSVERGHDPRDYTLVCFGGAAALHACELAERLEMPKVLVPAHAGVLSAMGMLVADCVRDYSASLLNEEAGPVFEALERTARHDLRHQRFEEVVLERSVDLRYSGQSYELNVPWGRVDRFDAVHEQRYGYCHAGRDVEAVTARVRAIGRTAGGDRPDLQAGGEQPLFTSIHVPQGWRARNRSGYGILLERRR